MIGFRFFKQRPACQQWSTQSWWMASLVLHSLVLLVPLLSNKAAVVEQDDIVPLAPVSLTAPPKPSPVAAVILPPLSRPQDNQGAIAPPRLATVPPVVLPAAVTQAPPPAASPLVTRPVAALLPRPLVAPAAAVPPPPPPLPSPTPAQAVPPSPPAETKTATETSPESTLVALVNAHPAVAGAQQGCAGRDDCWQTNNTQWREVATNLVQGLQTEGFEIEQLDLEQDTGVRVYRISKGEEPDYYLTLISTFQGTRYVMSQQPMTLDELNHVVSQ